MYYTKARFLLQDVTECRDLTSLQALIFCIMFLQVSSNLSGCYTFLGLALRSALRMGLHRNLSHIKFNPIESETRRRVFWAIRSLDLMVTAQLGFPILLQESDIDQLLPTEVDDEYITLDGLKSMPDNYTPVMSAVVAHTNLIKILRNVMKNIYPLKGLHLEGRPQSYTVSHAKIREIERQLSTWMDELPMGLRPGGIASPELER